MTTKSQKSQKEQFIWKCSTASRSNSFVDQDGCGGCSRKPFSTLAKAVQAAKYHRHYSSRDINIYSTTKGFLGTARQF